MIPSARDLQSRLLEIASLLKKLEANRTETVKGYGGEEVTLYGPKEALLNVEGLGIGFLAHTDLILKESYPDWAPASRARYLPVLQQMGQVLVRGLYDLTLWHPHIWQQATAGSEVFIGRAHQRGDLPVETKSQVWWHAVGRRFEEYPFDPHSAPVPWWTPDWQMNAVYLYASQRAYENVRTKEVVNREETVGVMSIWYYVGKDPTEQQSLPRVCIELGVPFGEPLDGAYPDLIAAARFLRLPFVSTEIVPGFNSHERKFYKRNQNAVPQVETVLLRKLARPESSPEREDGEVQRDFKCHFIVGGETGFWRKGKTWKNSGKTGDPEYVQPYVKGNLDMPFKPANRRVYLARR